MKKLKVGAVVYDPRVTVIWELIEKFFKERGQEIEAVFFKNYQLQVDALEKKEIDAAWNSPLAHLDAHLRLKGREKTGCMRDSDQDLTTYLVAKKGRFQSVQELAGKIIGFGAIDSPQARLIPIYYLKESGLAYDQDYKSRRFDIGVGLHGDHVGGEKDAVQALMKGDVDASFCLCANYDSWVKDGTLDENVVEVLGKTPKFDHCIFTFHEDVDDADIRAFDEILMEMDYNKKEDREILDLEGLKAWKEGRTSGYGPITKANEYLGNFIQAYNNGDFDVQ